MHQRILLYNYVYHPWLFPWSDLCNNKDVLLFLLVWVSFIIIIPN